MNWWRTHQRTAWICGLTLLVPLLLYLNTLVGLVGLHNEYQSDIDRLESRMARMLGLIQQEDRLRDSAKRARQQVVGLVYPAADDSATVSTTLQTGVRQILVNAGLSVTNSQVLPVNEQSHFDHIGLKLTASGDVDSLDAAMLALSQHRPLLLIESLGVRPERRKGSDSQIVTATMQLLSLRVRP